MSNVTKEWSVGCFRTSNSSLIEFQAKQSKEDEEMGGTHLKEITDEQVEKCRLTGDILCVLIVLAGAGSGFCTFFCALAWTIHLGSQGKALVISRDLWKMN